MEVRRHARFLEIDHRYAAVASALIAASEREGMWTLQAGIFPENTASLDLCMRAGFRIVGTRERVGRMDGRWRDFLLLQRRGAAADSDGITPDPA